MSSNQETETDTAQADPPTDPADIDPDDPLVGVPTEDDSPRELEIPSLEAVDKELNTLEALRRAADPKNEIQRASLQAQITQTRLMARRELSALDPNNLPTGVILTTSQSISENETGGAVAELGGTQFFTRVTAMQPVGEGSDVAVVGPNNQVVRADDPTADLTVEIKQQAQEFTLADAVQITASTEGVGQGNAAELDLGPLRRRWSLTFGVASDNDDIIVEVSPSGAAGSWTELTRQDTSKLDLTSGLAEDILRGETNFQYIRAFYGDGLSQSNISTLTLIARGD